MGGETQALFIPGWGNSDAGHWQSLWCAELPHARRVVQREWIQVSLDDWVETLDAFVQASGAPVVLVAHSLSCTLVSRWAARHDSSLVRAAMLVAPTDVEADTSPLETRCFAPIPLRQLPFRSVVVASEDDPYLTPRRARQFAEAWGSTFVSAGNAGHLNVKIRPRPLARRQRNPRGIDVGQIGPRHAVVSFRPTSTSGALVLARNV